MIVGPDLTQRVNATKKLADAWYIRNAVRLAEQRGKDVVWTFSTDGLERALTEMAPYVREAHLARVAEHIHRCARCRGVVLLLLLDAKYGARRFVCFSLDGYTELAEFGVSVQTGCMRNAPAGHFYCRQCRPEKLAKTQSHLIPQERVLGIVEAEGDASEGTIRYMVRCRDPDDATATFDAPLPRQEVDAGLLDVFERDLLPERSDHGNKQARPAWVKGHKQKARWLKFAGMSQSCGPTGATSLKDKSAKAPRGRLIPRAARARGRSSSFRGGRGRSGQRKDGGASQDSRRGRSRGHGSHRGRGRGAVKQTRRGASRGIAARTAAKSKRAAPAATPDACRRGERQWLELSADQRKQLPRCGIDKDTESRKKRRATGGMLTAVLQCGLLWDWAELARGEGTEAVDYPLPYALDSCFHAWRISPS